MQACLSTGLLRAGRRAAASLPSAPSTHQNIMHQQLRHKHQVRVILTRDLPDGQMRGVYAGEVHNVAAGYARNYLIPKKMAVYATPRNFERCGLVDPDIAAKEEAAKQKLAGDDEESEDLKAADLLRRYLRNKSVKIIRNVDPNMPTQTHPGHVTARNLRDKLSKQLKIDLDDPPHETIRIRNETIVGMDEYDDEMLMKLLREMDEEDVVPATAEASEGDEVVEAKEAGDGDDASEPKEAADSGEEAETGDTVAGETEGFNLSELSEEDLAELKDCDTKVKQVGDYVAKITLRGGYVVPLKFHVLRRQGGSNHHAK
ncbi:hypothetical protein ACHAXT_008772 [Thalassiosira profunda]